MKQHDAYVVHPTGQIERWTISRQSINATESLAAQFSKSLPVKIKGAFTVNKLRFNLHFETGNPSNFFCLTRILKLPLRVALVPSSIAPKESKIMVPELNESATLKTIDMLWQPPENCALVYMVQVHDHGNYYYCPQSNNYLFAYSDTGIYKLPLGNLYEDCRVCTGDYNSRGATIQEVCAVSMEQFINSKWNTHLIGSLDKLHRMFRWQATDTSFNQLAPDGNWKTISTKVSVPYQPYVVDVVAGV